MTKHLLSFSTCLARSCSKSSSDLSWISSMWPVLCSTCKEVANFALSLNIKLAVDQQFQSEKQGARWDALNISDSEYDDKVDFLSTQFAGRVDTCKMQNFLYRLDVGWNKAKSCLCYGCELFVPTSKSFWEKKSQSYLYKSNNPAARGYRIMKDCTCDCQPDSLIDDWIKRGKRDRNQAVGIRCPDCHYRETIVSLGGACERCCDMSMRPWDSYEDGCGFSDCNCHNCGCYSGY